MYRFSAVRATRFDEAAVTVSASALLAAPRSAACPDAPLVAGNAFGPDVAVPDDRSEQTYA
jgi:hypothetical protein